MTRPIPRLRAIPNDQIFSSDELVRATAAEPSDKGVLIRIEETPGPSELEALREYVTRHAERVVVEVSAKVPLAVLEHVAGVPFVVLKARTDFDGLDAMPVSVRRLSIGKHTKALDLGGLPALPLLEELQLDAPSVSRGPTLPALRTLAWLMATDKASAFIEQQASLFELALKNASVTSLPASGVERLLVFYSSKLTSLRGIERLKDLRFLRLDEPKGMARLGDLSSAHRLRVIQLVGAQTIGDLSDLGSAPALETLNVTLTKLDAAPFKGLKGKLTGGSFSLKTPKATRELMDYLDIPLVQGGWHEPTLFDL
jgi:hypothetical protein